MRLFLMRHAQCHSNVEGRMLGSSNAAARNDQPAESASELTLIGQAQAQALGIWLEQRATPPTHLYSSPLQRVLQTWDLLRQQGKATEKLNLTCDRRLSEIDQGIFTGLTWPEAQQRHPQLCNALEQSWDWIPIPRAESPQECRRRARSMVSHWLATHQPEDCLWIVSHGGFLSHLVSEILGCDRTWGCAIPPTGLFEFEFDLLRWNKGQESQFNTSLWRIHQFNSTEHLTPQRPC